jgi:hypothetical protein
LELRGTQKETYDALSKLFDGRKSSQGWPSFHYFTKDFTEEQNWISEEMMTKIMNGTLKNEIENELLALTKAAEDREIKL